jgi:hypothetical protein
MPLSHRHGEQIQGEKDIFNNKRAKMVKNLMRLILLPFAFIHSGGFLAKAKKLEKDGSYQEACYTYAVVLLNGVLVGKKEIQEKIKKLWFTYGPFDFDEELKKEIAKHGDTSEHCAEAGHAATLSIIHEIIENENNGTLKAENN